MKMHSSISLSVALCLVVSSASCNVIKTQEFPLSPAGLTMDVVVKNKGDHSPPFTLFNIDVDEKTKKVTVSNMGDVPEHRKSIRHGDDFIPSLENRHGIRVGTCPEGYTRRGGFCFPDDDY